MVVMMKVLCRGGPYHWVKEPYTPEEEAYFNGPCEQTKEGPEPLAPYPYGGKKGEQYYLGAGEVYPMTLAEELAAHKRYDGPMTFYGGAPHRPTSPAAVKPDQD
jgi:hypothetical protein